MDASRGSGSRWWRFVVYGLALGGAVAAVLDVGVRVGRGRTQREAVAYGHAAWGKDGFVWHATQCGCPGLGLSILPEEWAMGVDESVRTLGARQEALDDRIKRLEESGTVPANK